MARTNNTLKNTGLIVAVVAAAFGIGYFVLGGPRTAPAPTDTLSVPAAAPPAVAAPRITSAPDPHIQPRAKNSDYTAPNAPRIRIVEEKSSSLTRRPAVPQAPADTPTSVSSTDSEASQAAAPTNASPSTDTSSGSTTGTSSASGTDASGSAPLIPPSATTASGTPDQDFEQVGGHGSAEAGQDGAASGGKAQFRVQTGSFAAQQNARILADALRSRGYTTSTHAEQEDGKTVYKVQIGAYRSRAAADKAAQDLQKSGYPAYSSPIGP